MEIKIYVVNLAKYNRGGFTGEWLTLPMDEGDLQEAIGGILGTDEEYAIHDYEAPFDMGEYENIIELNELAEQFEGVTEDPAVVAAIFDDLDVSNTRESIVEIIKNREYTVIPEVRTPAQLAKQAFYYEPSMLPIYQGAEDPGAVMEWIDKNTALLDWGVIGVRMEQEGWNICDRQGFAINLHR